MKLNAIRKTLNLNEKGEVKGRVREKERVRQNEGDRDVQIDRCIYREREIQRVTIKVEIHKKIERQLFFL